MSVSDEGGKRFEVFSEIPAKGSLLNLAFQVPLEPKKWILNDGDRTFLLPPLSDAAPPAPTLGAFGTR
jgi:hypothetical protein